MQRRESFKRTVTQREARRPVSAEVLIAAPRTQYDTLAPVSHAASLSQPAKQAKQATKLESDVHISAAESDGWLIADPSMHSQATPLVPGPAHRPTQTSGLMPVLPVVPVAHESKSPANGGAEQTASRRPMPPIPAAALRATTRPGVGFSDTQTPTPSSRSRLTPPPPPAAAMRRTPTPSAPTSLPSAASARTLIPAPPLAAEAQTRAEPQRPDPTTMATQPLPRHVTPDGDRNPDTLVMQQLQRQLLLALERVRSSETRLVEAERRAQWAAQHTVQQARRSSVPAPAPAPTPRTKTLTRYVERGLAPALAICLVCFSVGGYLSLLIPVRQRVLEQEAALYSLDRVRQRLEIQNHELMAHLRALDPEHFGEPVKSIVPGMPANLEGQALTPSPSTSVAPKQ